MYDEVTLMFIRPNHNEGLYLLRKEISFTTTKIMIQIINHIRIKLLGVLFNHP